MTSSIQDRRGRGCVATAACLLSAVISMAGCAEYVPAPIAAVDTAAKLESRNLDDPRLMSFIQAAKPGTSPSGWNLSNLTLAALYFRPDMELSRAKLAVAEAEGVTARQRPNPVLSLLSSFNATVTTPSPWTVGGAINVLIDATGQRSARIARSESMVEAARQDLATASWQVRGQVRTALIELWATKGRHELLSRRAALQEQFIDVLERRFTVGGASALDVSRERITLNQLRLGLADVQRQATEARIKLAAAIGVPEKAVANIEPLLAEFDKPVGQSLSASMSDSDFRRTALERRSDVLGMLAEYEATQAALRLEIAKQYPTLTVGPGYAYDQRENKYSLELGGDLPVLNQNQGPVAEGVARRREAGARFMVLQAQIINTIDLAQANRHAAATLYGIADTQFVNQTSRTSRLQRGLQFGEFDQSTITAAEVELSVAELARYDAMVQQRQALGELEDALQQPLFGSDGVEFMRINAARTVP